MCYYVMLNVLYSIFYMSTCFHRTPDFATKTTKLILIGRKKTKEIFPILLQPLVLMKENIPYMKATIEKIPVSHIFTSLH